MVQLCLHFEDMLETVLLLHTLKEVIEGRPVGKEWFWFIFWFITSIHQYIFERLHPDRGLTLKDNYITGSIMGLSSVWRVCIKLHSSTEPEKEIYAFCMKLKSGQIEQNW